jgi:hypothetical protein
MAGVISNVTAILRNINRLNSASEKEPPSAESNNIIQYYFAKKILLKQAHNKKFDIKRQQNLYSYKALGPKEKLR